MSLRCTGKLTYEEGRMKSSFLHTSYSLASEECVRKERPILHPNSSRTRQSLRKHSKLIYSGTNREARRCQNPSLCYDKPPIVEDDL